VAKDNAHLSAEKDDQSKIKKVGSVDKLHQKIFRNSLEVKEKCLIRVKPNNIFN